MFLLFISYNKIFTIFVHTQTAHFDVHIPQVGKLKTGRDSPCLFKPISKYFHIFNIIFDSSLYLQSRSTGGATTPF